VIAAETGRAEFQKGECYLKKKKERKKEKKKVQKIG
jgi:hypothetical protein